MCEYPTNRVLPEKYDVFLVTSTCEFWSSPSVSVKNIERAVKSRPWSRRTAAVRAKKSYVPITVLLRRRFARREVKTRVWSASQTISERSINWSGMGRGEVQGDDGSWRSTRPGRNRRVTTTHVFAYDRAARLSHNVRECHCRRGEINRRPLRGHACIYVSYDE